ncbi:MAG: lipoyl synthase, partial [Bacteroidota bacterium]
LEHGCDVLTIGQYLQPTKMHLEVAEYIHPDVFAMYHEVGMEKGFDFVESGPLVRSSYHAERHVFPNRNK